MNVKIKKRVRELMKDYKVCNKRLENELITACEEEYEKQLAAEVEDETAFKSSVANVESALKETFKKKNKYVFSLTICSIALIVSIIEMISPSIYYGAQYFYVNEMPVAILALTAGLIYTASKWRKYHWYDFVILAAVLISWLATLIQIGFFTLLLSPAMPDRYYAAEYVFPCVIKLLKILNTSLLPFYTFYVCSLNFILSAIATVVFTALTVKTTMKMKQNENKSTAVENEIFTAVVSDIIKTNNSAKSKYIFTLTVCVCALLMSVMEMIISYCNQGNTLAYSLGVTGSFMILLAVLIYATVKRKDFQPLDFIVLAVLLVFWLLTLIQIIVYAVKAVNPDIDVSAYYTFPCIIEIFIYQGEKNELTNKVIAYNFDFIISVVLTIVMSALAIKEKIQIRTNKKAN